MALLNETGIMNQKPGKPRPAKANPGMDMTPMVDLGFLLICFFVYTATMNEPKATDLFMPAEGPPVTLGRSGTLTFLLGRQNRIAWYERSWEEAIAGNTVRSGNYSVHAGIGDIIRRKQQQMLEPKAGKEGRNRLVLIIKATQEASYKNLMDVLDEILINDVRHYTVVDPSAEEGRFMQ